MGVKQNIFRDAGLVLSETASRLETTDCVAGPDRRAVLSYGGDLTTSLFLRDRRQMERVGGRLFVIWLRLSMGDCVSPGEWRNPSLDDRSEMPAGRQVHINELSGNRT